MAEQQKVEAQFGKTDLRSTLVSLSANIVLGAKTSGNLSQDYEHLFGWGSQISCFDSLIVVMVKDDAEFFKKRAMLKKSIAELSSNLSNRSGRFKLFNAYNSWFALLCSKMPIYPEGSTNAVLENIDIDEEDL